MTRSLYVYPEDGYRKYIRNIIAICKLDYTHHKPKRAQLLYRYALSKVRTIDAFVITCVANLMEVKVLYVQQDLRHEISSYWRFNV
jgi:hypothetical protein